MYFRTSYAGYLCSASEFFWFSVVLYVDQDDNFKGLTVNISVLL